MTRAAPNPAGRPRFNPMIGMKRFLIIAMILAPWLQAWGQTNLAGIWIATVGPHRGEMEIVFDLKVEAGRISGTASLPSQDMPIIDGKLSGILVEMTLSMDYYGQERRIVAKGTLVEDYLLLSMPMIWWLEPAGGMGRMGGMGGPERRWGPPGNRVPRKLGAPNPEPQWREPNNPPPPPFEFRLSSPLDIVREVSLRRGTPAQPRRQRIDYKALAKVTLPTEKDLPSNGLAPTPPMGWTSKQRFRGVIDDRAVREIAVAMAANGMRDAGYVYLNLDDGWQGERDARGVLQPNGLFPDMKALADFVHAQGLKLGLYSSPAPQTYRGHLGSYGHEEQDAQTWAAWGIDYLKYEWCAAGRVYTNARQMRLACQKMAEALRATPRPIVYALCQYGREQVWLWGAKAGANLSRTTIDINNYWSMASRIGFSQAAISSLAGPGHWHDLDALVIGNDAMSEAECRAQFSLWAILAAPLFASHDPRVMYPSLQSILLNREVIAVDQDRLGQPGRRFLRNGDLEIWTRPLANGDLATGLFNRGEQDAEMEVRWEDLGWPVPAKIRDLWTHAHLPVTKRFSGKVPAHGVIFLRLSK
jgi:alpha-galactosidase